MRQCFWPQIAISFIVFVTVSSINGCHVHNLHWSIHKCRSSLQYYMVCVSLQSTIFYKTYLKMSSNAVHISYALEVLSRKKQNTFLHFVRIVLCRPLLKTITGNANKCFCQLNAYALPHKGYTFTSENKQILLRLLHYSFSFLKLWLTS